MGYWSIGDGVLEYSNTPFLRPIRPPGDNARPEVFEKFSNFFSTEPLGIR